MASENPPAEPAEFLGGGSAAQPASAESASSPPAGESTQVQAKPPRTRTSIAFSGFVMGAIVLLLLLIFILENTQSVKVGYFGASGHVALGVALLFAAVGGAVIVGILGAARIAQVRRHAKRRSRSADY